jgi:hypothetical protein
MSELLIACPRGTTRWKFVSQDASSFLLDSRIRKIGRLLLPMCLMLWIVAAGVAPAQTLPQQPSAVFAAPSVDGTGHLIRIYPMGQKNGASSKRVKSKVSDNTTSVGAATSGGPDLQYYGGPVISSVQVLVVYWGNNVSPIATTGIPGFFSAVTNSNWTDTLSEYSTNGVIPVVGGTAGTQAIGRGSLSGVFSITPSAANSGTLVDDSQIQVELLAQINAGHLPAPATDSNGLVTTLYMIYFPPGVTISLQGAESCVQFCAYHGTVNLNSLDVPYGVLPDLGPTAACSSGCAGGTELEDLTTVSSHELAEAITDTAVGLATTDGPPLAWYDTVNGEIGDICNASGDPNNQAVLSGSGYTVQKIWSNIQQDCVSAPPTFTLTAPASVLASTPFTLSLTVQSSTGIALSPPYTGTVGFTSSDGSAILPGNYTFTTADANTHTFNNVATLKTTGSQTITVTDTHAGGFVGTAQVTVNAHTSPYFSLAVPAAATTGTPFTFTVTAMTQSGNLNTSYSGTVRFTSSDGQALLPANATLTNGTGTFTATLRTSGSQTITATDTVTSTITGTSQNIRASGAATHFAVNAPSSATTGVAFNFTVTAQDQSNNTALGYSGTVHFTSTDRQAVLPANVTLANGTGTFSATLKTAGTQTITATDTVTSTITGTSSGIVDGNATTHFAVTAPPSAISGTAFNFTVTAQDQSNNTTPAYSGTIRFNSSDGQAVLPASTTLTNGTGTFVAALKTSGIQTITATDTITSTITGVSGNISVVTATPAATPTLSPNPGTYTTPQSVTLTDASPGVTIYYTTNGSTPTTTSTPYTGPITVSTTTTLQAIAAGNGFAASPDAFGIYRINAAAPTFSPYPGTYTTPQSVTIADSSPGVTIYYTTDGSTPTTASPRYTAPITISSTTTLQAIAAGNGFAASSADFGIYRITAAAPTFSPNPGNYTAAQTVTIADSSPGVSIYYTTDGSTPTTASPHYTGPITISSTTTLQAIAAGNGFAASSEDFGIYRITIAAAAPTFSPSPGTYSTGQSVTLSDVSPGVTIYYTTNGATPTTASQVYTGPITLSTSTTLQAIAAGNGYGASSVSSGRYNITSPTATPTFSPAPGTYNTPQSVTLSDASPGVTIYYTTNGSTPTTASPQYTGPITLSTTTTLQAIAAGNGYPASAPASGTYRITTATPTFSPNPGTYTTPQSVTITDASPGVTIYYTTNGSTPTTASPQYSGPITISSTTTLQAIAAGNGFAASSDAFGIYRITAAAPTFSPYPGTYTTPQTVTIADASPGVAIYYTTNGSTPTTSSTLYTGPLTISTTTTLQAIAAGNGFAASSENFGIYRINAAAPTFSPNPGTYSTPQTVTIADSSPGVTIYYTTDGSTPTTASPQYSGPITISVNTTLQAIAAGNGFATSSEDFGIYRIN